MDTVEAIIGQAVRLALAGGIGLPVVLGIVVVLAIMLVVAKRLPPPDPPPLPDPDAEWNQDPAAGAVVKPGPPGGTDDQVQSG